MKVRFTGEVDVNVSDPEDRQLICDCTLAVIWSHLNDVGSTALSMESMKLNIEMLELSSFSDV